MRLTGRPVLLVGYGCRLIRGDVRLSDEHDAFRWIGGAELPEIDDGSTYAAALRAWFAEDRGQHRRPPCGVAASSEIAAMSDDFEAAP